MCENKKRITGWAVLLFFFLLLLSAGAGKACGRQPVSAKEQADGRLKIVCTIFPEYDWIRQILGGQEKGAELTLLMKNGADLHSYQPTVWDMRKIAEADLFVYVGGESDFWAEKALENTKKAGRRTLALMDILEDAAKEEEHTEGMQKERRHEEGHGPEEPEYDEHLWLSLRNAETVCEALTEALCELDAAHSSLYVSNNRSYQEKLRALDLEYEKTVEQASAPVLVFGDRFPFRYLAEDYGIQYYAAFAGCSAETEASFGTIAFLAEKTGELGLPAVMKIDGSDGRIARTVADNTKTRDQKVLLLDSMQSVNGQDIEDGENYLAIMERNLAALKEAFKER